MVADEKKALKALHRLVHQGRALAHEGNFDQEWAWCFDEMDYLLGMGVKCSAVSF